MHRWRGDACQFTPDSGQITLAARHARLELGSALHVKLGIAQLQRIAHRCAVVVFLQQIGMARLGLAQLGLQNGTRIGIAGALVVVVDPRAPAGEAVAPLGAAAPDALGLGRTPCITVTFPPSTSLQPRSLACAALLVYSLPQR